MPPLAGLLDDPRVAVTVADVLDAVPALPRAGLHAVLLDVDNGPDGLVRAENGRIYAFAGLRAARAALAPGGVVAVWSPARDPAFTRRLEKARFAVEEIEVRARPNNKGPRHTIWFARR